MVTDFFAVGVQDVGSYGEFLFFILGFRDMTVIGLCCSCCFRQIR